MDICLLLQTFFLRLSCWRWTNPACRQPIPQLLRSSTVAALLLLLITGCSAEKNNSAPALNWYVFAEPSGAFTEAAASCSRQSAGRYTINLVPLPADADQQREQLVRRLAAGDSAVDIIGMDVIWTAEFAAAGWIIPWPKELAAEVIEGRLNSAVAGATFHNRLQAAPFTTNSQLLWYRKDRVAKPPETWDELIDMAESLGNVGTIQVQGERYEGLTVFFNSLLASAGGRIIDKNQLQLDDKPTVKALQVMRRLALSPAASATLSTSREDQCRLAFEQGDSTFMVNYTFVWPSALQNAPEIADHMAWAHWPAISADQPSRVTLGGINLGIGAFGKDPPLAFEAASCLVSAGNQRLAAEKGGLPPTITALYKESEVRKTFPFADVLLKTLENGVQRPQTPLYNDISLAISHTLHPMRDIEPKKDTARLKRAIERALHSEGLL